MCSGLLFGVKKMFQKVVVMLHYCGHSGLLTLNECLAWYTVCVKLTGNYNQINKHRWNMQATPYEDTFSLFLSLCPIPCLKKK